MGLVAYQLVDFNNPISVSYSQHSINSFKPVRDLIDIIPVQCVVPDTLPQDRFYGDSKERTVYEQSCFCSHYSLVKRRLTGEKFFIMEHDAYLWPQDERIFRKFIQTYLKYEIFYLGIANEFYYLSDIMCKNYVKALEDGSINGGPMTHVALVYEKCVKNTSTKILWPMKGQVNRICFSNSIDSAILGEGEVYRAPVTQHMNLSVGSTIKERKRKWKFNLENNPDMYFTK